MSAPHDCTYAEAVLTGESPAPMGDLSPFDAGVAACPSCAALAEALADIDDLAAGLPDLTVPAELSRRTLDLVRAELAPTPMRRPVKRQRWPLYMLVGGLSVAAATLLAVWPGGPAPAPPERLVARGNATSLPSVSLKVAVDDGQGLTRHRRDQAYPAGTRVQFRVGLDAPADVALLRVDETGSQVVTRSSLAGGDHDLQLGGAPLAWEVEPGEHDARFVVVAGPAGSLSEEAIQAVPSGAATLDEPGVCAHVTHLSCDERLLQVSP